MARAGNSGRWLTPGLGPLIGLRVSVSRNPWRIGPAWAVVAGALAAGMPIGSSAALLRLLGAVLLADSAWGAVWAVMAGDGGQPRPPESWGLPYIHPSAPIMQVSDRLRGLSSGVGCHDLLMSMVLALGLSALLGLVPFVLSLLVLAIALIAQTMAERGRRPALAYSLLAVGLPWSLGLALSGQSTPALVGPIALGMAFLLLVWAFERLRGRRRTSTFGAWLGQLAVLGTLAGLRLPWAAALTAALFLPPSWYLLHARAARGTPAAADFMTSAIERSAVWCWLVFLLAAVAMRQIVAA